MINKVILVGRLGADPELREFDNSTLCSLRVATNSSRKAPDGTWVEETEWHRVCVWGKTAEACNKYLASGSTVYVEGRLSTRKWQDKEGNDRYSTDVIAQLVRFLGSPGKKSESSNLVEEGPQCDDLPF